MLRRLLSPSARSLAALVVSAAALVAPCAPAQFGGNTGFAEAFKPDFLPRDMVLFSEFLDLEEWQKPIVEALLTDYSDAYHAGMNGIKDKMQSTGDIAARGAAGIMPLLDDWIREKAKLREEFLANVKSQLSEAQVARWPRFDRAFRRDKMLHLGELSGESTDLLALLKQISLDSAAQAGLQPVLDTYEVELDDALQAREKVMKEQQPKVQEAMIGMDFDRGVEAVEKIMVSRARVRDANVRAAEAIADALPAGRKEEFTQRWRTAAFPRVYRNAAPLERLFVTAAESADLTSEQKAAVAAIKTSFDQRHEALCAEGVAILKNEEPKDARRKAERVKGRNQGGSAARPPDYLADFMQRREQLYQQVRDEVEAVIGAELMAKMPAATRERAPEPARGDRAKAPTQIPGRAAGAPSSRPSDGKSSD